MLHDLKSQLRPAIVLFAVLTVITASRAVAAIVILFILASFDADFGNRREDSPLDDEGRQRTWQGRKASPPPAPTIRARENYRIDIASPLRSALICNPTWRPESVKVEPFSLTSAMTCAPTPTAAPAPPAP